MSAEEAPKKPEEKGTDELDLRSIFAAVGRFFKSIFNALIWLLLYIRRLIIGNLVWAVIIAAVGTAAGVGYSFMERPYYRAEMVINSKYFKGTFIKNYVAVLNSLAEDEDYAQLGEQLGIDSTVASNIRAINIEALINEARRQGLETLLEELEAQPIESEGDIRQREILRGKLNAEGEYTYKLAFELWDPAAADIIREPVVKKLTSIDYIKKRFDVKQRNLKKRKAKIEDQFNELDSLKLLTYDNFAAVAERNRKNPSGGYQIFMGSEQSELGEPLKIFYKDYEMFDKLLQVETDIELQDDFEVVLPLITFTVSENQPKHIRGIWGGVYGVIFFIIIVVLRDLNNLMAKEDEKRKAKTA